MGKETGKQIDIKCKKRHLIFEGYNKVGKGRLLKVYQDQVKKDHTIPQEKEGLEIGDFIYCGICEPPLAVASLQMIHGKLAYKIKSSGVPKTRT